MQESVLAGLEVLMIEDELLLRKRIGSCLERMGASVTGVDTLERARAVLEDLNFDFVLLDVNLPDGLGTDLLKEKRFSAATGVIVITGEGAVSGAVEAMRLGAVDYLVKPFDPAELPLVLARARRSQQNERVEEQKRRAADDSRATFFFGSSLAALEEQLEKILKADQRLQNSLPPVLIQGETGTGKTTIARWLHHQGPRARQPLVEVNCSALPETLAESELFGHERGAFTDARTARMGLFEAASGGTLFLDEVPSLSPGLQAKVLTAIEDHKIRRVGGNKEIPVDARIIAATNRDLKKLVEEGSFREDLYHRLDLYRIAIPPLRERGRDILQLAAGLLEQLVRRHRMEMKTISAEGEQRLLGYAWPGNVRELAHELERAIVFEDGACLNFEHLEGVRERPGLAGARREEMPARTGAGGEDWFNDGFSFPAEGFSLEDAINRLIQHALKQTGKNVSGAARLLGVSRDYVRYRLTDGESRGD